MDFLEAELRYYPVADVLTAQDRRDYAKGRPTPKARRAMYLWNCNRVGEYELSDAFVSLIGRHSAYRLAKGQSRKVGFSRHYARYEPVTDVPIRCKACGFSGIARARSKLDAVCSNCKSVRLEYL